MADKNFRVKNGLEVGDNFTVDASDGAITLAQGAVISYSEDDDRTLRPTVQSTTGDTSGLRVQAPNDTTSAVANLSVFNTDDNANGKFLSVQARGSATDPLRIVTGEYASGVLQATGDSIVFRDGSGATHAAINPSGPTNSTDLTTKSYVDTAVAGKDNTDEITEGSTNLYFTQSRARQSVSVTDTGGDGSLSYDNSTGVFTYTGPSASEVRAHFSGGTGVTITDGAVAIGQSVGTGDSPTFAGVTAGNLTVGLTDNNTITSTNTNGNITLDPNGTGVIVFDSIQRLRGESQASTNNSYTFPPNLLTTITDNNGYSAASSFAPGTNGYPANAQYVHYTADTLAGTNSVAAMNFKQANGNSVAGETIPWTGLTSVAPSASTSSDVLGTINYNGYASTGFTNDIATQYQGGGIATSHILQVQGYPTETPVEGTVTLTSANITAVASSFRSTMTSPSVVGTKGQIKWTGTQGGVGQAVRVTGTLTGNATGISSGSSYYMIAYSNDGTFSYATLSATPNGNPIDTTGSTLTGLTLTRCGVTFTLSGQTVYPFGRNAKVTVSGVNNVTDGTYPVSGAVSSLTSISLGIPHTTAPTLSGSQQFTCASITSAGGGLRVRGFPNATIMNPANRLTIFDTTAAATTVRSDAFSLYKGTYGGTGALLPSGDISYARQYGCWHKTANVTAAAADTVYAFDWTTDTTAHVANQGITISNTSRINFANSGTYNVVIEMVGKNTDNADRTAYVWLSKNGTDISETAIKLVLTKDTTTMLAKDWLVDGIADNDYIEVRFAVDTTVSGISLEYTASSTSPYTRPAVPSATITITPVGA